MHASEIRQIAKFSEVVIVSDTAPPIRAAFPPLAVMRNGYIANRKGAPREIHLGDIDNAFLLTKTPVAKNESAVTREDYISVISSEVDRVFTDERIVELFNYGTETAMPNMHSDVRKVKSTDGNTNMASHAEALDDLTADLRLMLAEKYERVLSPV
jgi:hypothetical protein